MAAVTYPVFSIESIATRCQQDLNDFAAQEKMTLDNRFALIKNITTKAGIEEAIKPIKEFIETSLPSSSSTYVTSISKATNQKDLWIARTYLFYQLMIFVVAILGSSELYGEVFGEVDNKTVFPFKEGFVTELALYQMGIFGSKTPTSDIDVGIQYIGTSSERPGLAYMISAFENVFVKLTGKSSLDFDIEPYADMYLYKGDNGSDYFYLDTGTFTIENFKRILPVAGQSIARNALIDHGTRPESFQQIVDGVKAALTTSNAYADCLASIKDAEIVAALNDPQWLNQSMDKMNAFLSMPTYDDQRAMYYEMVEKAETLKFAKAPNFNMAKTLDNDSVCELIVAFGDALSYRMESYTGSPTITHVVRILQVDKAASIKYATKSPIELCNGVPKGEDPYCAIGKFGFIISILEQMGYMYRFYNHYCIGSEANPEKCDKKIKKYGERYNNAFSSYSKNLVVATGGKRRHRRTMNKRTRRSRNNKRKGRKTRR